MKANRVFILIHLVCFSSLISCKKDSDIKVTKNHKQAVGTSANDLLSDKNYESLLVEIQYVEGYKPTQTAIDNLKTFLSQRLNKPEGISFIWKSIAPIGKSTFTIDDIKKIEDNNRSEFTDKKTIAVYFLFLDGEYAENTSNSKVLGIAYRNTSMVIFEKTVVELSDNILTEPERDKLETTVINHEFGHILGLVNVGSPMQNDHQDTANGKHCTNSDCLMYWTAETDNVINNLMGSNPVPELDQNCIDDLINNGGK